MEAEEFSYCSSCRETVHDAFMSPGGVCNSCTPQGIKNQDDWDKFLGDLWKKHPKVLHDIWG